MNISNNQIKYIKSLHQPKFRQMYENFVAEGDKLVSYLLNSQSFEVEMIVATTSWLEQNPPFQKYFGDRILIAEKEKLEQISLFKTAGEVLVVLKKSKSEFKIDLIRSHFSFYLDGVQDPGNVGTIIRIADWFGFKSVCRSEDSADFYNPKVVQSSMGSIANVSLYTLEREVVTTLDLPLYLTDMDGEDVGLMENQIPGMIVLGSEGRGISDVFWNAAVKHIISIPSPAGTKAESLNVSVAAGIVAHQFTRKKL